MKKKFTEKQMAFLATQERDMRTAVESNWSRYPGQANIEQMRKIWEELTGQTREIRLSCSSCILNLVRDMGILYFAQKKEQEADLAAAAAKAARAAAEAAAAAKAAEEAAKAADAGEAPEGEAPEGAPEGEAPEPAAPAVEPAEVPADSVKPAEPTAEPTEPQKPAKAAKTTKGKK